MQIESQNHGVNQSANTNANTEPSATDTTSDFLVNQTIRDISVPETSPHRETEPTTDRNAEQTASVARTDMEPTMEDRNTAIGQVMNNPSTPSNSFNNDAERNNYVRHYMIFAASSSFVTLTYLSLIFSNETNIFNSNYFRDLCISLNDRNLLFFRGIVFGSAFIIMAQICYRCKQAEWNWSDTPTSAMVAPAGSDKKNNKHKMHLRGAMSIASLPALVYFAISITHIVMALWRL